MRRLECDLTVSFPGFRLALQHAFALDGITVVLGASGSGKSTLLRAIAGLEPEVEGVIRYHDECWLDSARGARVAPHRRGCGFVFQDARLLSFLTVSGNLRYADRRSPGGLGQPAMAEVIDAFDLKTLLHRATGSLSGGERQRVAMARALLTAPRLLLMDEPLSANDIGRKAALLPYVRQLPVRFGVPVLYVTHSLDEAARLADQVLVLAAGERQVAGDVADVLERLDPAIDESGWNESGVLLHGTVIGHDPDYQLSTVAVPGGEMQLPWLAGAPGSSVRLRIRARDVALALGRPDGLSIRNVLPGEVIAVMSEPASAFADVVVAVGASRIRARITRAAADDLALEPGVAVHVLIKSVTLDDRQLPVA